MQHYTASSTSSYFTHCSFATTTTYSPTTSLKHPVSGSSGPTPSAGKLSILRSSVCDPACFCLILFTCEIPRNIILLIVRRPDDVVLTANSTPYCLLAHSSFLSIYSSCLFSCESRISPPFLIICLPAGHFCRLTSIYRRICFIGVPVNIHTAGRNKRPVFVFATFCTIMRTSHLVGGPTGF